MSIESLKQQARKHEQNEEWRKALDQYNKALAELAREEQVDIGLYNRVGDLYVREKQVDLAVEHYEKAVDLYREAYLPNNAIAVCKKIIRNVPERHRAYLVIGQIRAEQGFIPDARTNFLTYAERMQQAGDLTESFRALIEFCDLAPDDIGVRMTVAEQMASKGMTDEAVEQLIIVRQHFDQLGDHQQVEDLGSRILHLKPDADLSAAAATSVSSDGEIVGNFGEFGLGDAAFGISTEEEVSFAIENAAEEAAGDADAAPEADQGEDEEAGDFGGFSIDADGGDAGDDGAGDDAEVEGSFDLPLMGSDDDQEEAEPLPTFDDEPEEDATPLPTMDFESDDDADAGEELPMFDVDTSETEIVTTELPGFDDEGEPEPVPIPTIDFGEESDEPTSTWESEDAPVEELPTFDDAGPADVAMDGGIAALSEDAAEKAEKALPSMGLEDAFDAVADSLHDAQESIEEAVEEVAGETGFSAPDLDVEAPTFDAPSEPEVAAPPEPEVVPEPVASPEPETPPAAEPSKPDDGGFIDLGAMILGDTQEKSTRFTVAYEEPSGDEEADFAKMLSQFKDKVSENLEASDVRAHYDLGTAYKEMGLLDEAISSFQAALRASSDHLPTYELMGQTFIEMGQPEAAVRSLERAIESANTVDDELVGIYYYLGRAYEQLGNRESAAEFYDRVFSLDINFADVTERLRELR